MWSGKGSCYLSSHTSFLGACDYSVRIERKPESLYVLKCIVWHQEWGDGIECPERLYEVRGSELWLQGPRGPFKAGAFSDREINIDYAFPGGFTQEVFTLTETGMNHQTTYQSTGKRWLYDVELNAE
jgi:hypothetical protein